MASQGTARADESELIDMDLEELMRVRVTSVSKHPESRFTAGAAVYVLTGEELRRNGFTTFADSLRTVPGMHVARVNSHTWAVSPRGFNGEYASKLLVLNDGRSVYTPLSSGVYWDTLDFLFEDVDRVEVIRGPGAPLWGANAVNGIVNVITKSAEETQGLLLFGGGGTEIRGFGGVRYGDKINENAWYRVYVKHRDYDDLAFANDTDAMDDWWMTRGGFRVDWKPEESHHVMFRGDFYQGRESHFITVPTPTPPFLDSRYLDSDISGGSIIGRWNYEISEDAEFELQAFYDHTDRESNLPREQRDTFDVEFQNSFRCWDWNRFTWGLGYRVSADRIHGDFAQSFSPTERTLNLFSAFLQDEISIIPEVLNFTVGSRFEHNDFTGFEFQPGGRLVWTPTDNHTFWGAITRAVRTPNRAEDDVQVNLPTTTPGIVFNISGNRGGQSEDLIAYELGYRVLPHPNVSLDIAAFYNDYQDLRSLEFTSPTSAYSGNNLEGETYGVELAGEWQVQSGWRLQAAYTFFHAHLRLVNGSVDINTERLIEGSTPAQQVSLRSSHDLGRNVEFDWGLRFVDELNNPYIPAYLTLDVRLGWRPTDNLEISVAGLNLLDDRHPEFASQVIATPIREVQRGVYGKITWRF